MEVMNPSKLIPIILYSVAFGITFVHISGIPNAVKKWLMDKRIWYTPVKDGWLETGYMEGAIRGKVLPRRIKPFDCETCMAFWTGITLLMFPKILTYEIIHALFSGCIIACLTVWAFKLLKP